MSAIVEIGFNADQVYTGLGKLEGRLSGFASRMDRTLAGIGKNIGLAGAFNLPVVARFGGELVQAAAKMEGYRAALTAVTKDTVPLEAQLTRLRELAKSPGLSFDEALKGSVRLQATGLSAKNSEMVLREMANALRAVGGSASQLDGITLALSQIQAKGKVSAEEINQIAERMPQIRAVMKTAFGTADTEALQKMGLSSERFILGITQELAKAPRVMSGANSAIEQLVDNFEQMKAAAGEPLAQAIVPIIKDMTKAVVENAPEMKKMAEEIIRLAPVAFGAGKGLLSIYAAAKALQLGTFIAGLIAKRNAMSQSTSAINAETSALQTNTAAHRANSSSRTGRGPVVPAAMPPPTLSVPGLNGTGTPPSASSPPANMLMTRLAGGISSMGPMIGTAATAMYTSSLLPASLSAGQQAAHAIQQSLMVGMSAMGGKLGAAALGGSLVQALMLKHATNNLEGAQGVSGQIDRTQEAAKESAAMLKNGNLAQARKILEAEINLLVGERASASGDEAVAAGVSLSLMQRELATINTRNEAIKKAAALAREVAAEELKAAKVREQMAAQKEAKGRVGDLTRDVQTQGIRFESPDRQFELWGEVLKQKLQAAMANVNSSRFLGGKEQLTGVEASMQGIQAAVDRLKAAGDWINAEKLLQALKDAQPEAEKLAELSQKMRESAAAASAEAAEKAKSASLAEHRVEMAKLEAAYEERVIAAKMASGGRDTAAVRAAEDELAARRLTLQIEDAGVASGAAAWNMAVKRVETQRQLSTLLERQQQSQARTSVAEDIAILQAKVAGQDDLVKKLEREKEIRERTRQLMQETGATQPQARQVATKMVDLQAQVDAKSNRGGKNSRYDENGMRADGRHKIDANIKRGDNQDHLYGTGANSGEAKRQAARERLAKQYAKFQEPLYDDKGGSKSPVAQKAAQNAAKQDATTTDSNGQAGQQALQIMGQMLALMQ